MKTAEKLTGSLRRLYLVMKADLYTIYHYYIPFSMTVFFVVLLLSLISGPSIRTGFYNSIFSLLLIVGTAVVASGSFKDVYTGTLVHNWLLLPATVYEKVLSRIIITYPLFLILVSVLFFLTSVLSYGWTLLLHHEGTVIFVPFKPLLELAPQLFFIHGIFFLGASIFRKSPFFKTLLSLVLIMLSTFIIMSFALVKYLRTLDIQTIKNLQMKGNGILHFEPFSLSGGASEMIQIIISLGIPIVCWIIPFLRMRRMEAHRAL